MLKDFKPSRPVYTSQLSAQKAAEIWTRAQDDRRIVDGDGFEWKAEIRRKQSASASDPNELEWRAKIQLRAKASADNLIECAALDPAQDERLIALLGEAQVPLAMKPVLVRSDREEELEQKILEVLSELSERLVRTSLLEIKRVLVGRWIDHRCRFGEAEMREKF